MKGQIVSLDIIFALVIFAIAIGGVLQAEASISNAVNDVEEARRMQDRLIELSDQLVMSRGEPDGWYNTSKVKSVGLMYKDHWLSEDKLIALTRMSTQNLRGNLSVGPNNLYVQLLANSGAENCTVRSTNITVGTVPSSPRERSAMERRVMIEDGRNCTLRVTLWRS